MLHDIKGFFKVIARTVPPVAIRDPHKDKTFRHICFQGEVFITACSFVELAAPTAIEIGLNSINRVRCFDYKIEPFFRLSLI